MSKVQGRQRKRLWTFFGCLLLALFTSGCGVYIETSYYHFSPSWIHDGKIIFVSRQQSTKRFAFSNVSTENTEYVQTIGSAGAGESGALIDATAAPPLQMTCSPSAEYVAYGNILVEGLFRKVVIRSFSQGTRSGLEKVELVFNPGVKSFDWSADGTRIVYCTTNEVRTVKLDGTSDTLLTAEANLEFVSWQNGGRIAFIRTSGADKLLSVISSDGTGRLDLTAATSVDLPQISAANTNEVYGLVAGGYQKVDLNTLVRTSLVAAGFGGSLPRLSPDATKITYSKTGEDSGVYVMTLATGVETKIK